VNWKGIWMVDVEEREKERGPNQRTLKWFNMVPFLAKFGRHCHTRVWHAPCARPFTSSPHRPSRLKWPSYLTCQSSWRRASRLSNREGDRFRSGVADIRWTSISTTTRAWSDSSMRPTTDSSLGSSHLAATRRPSTFSAHARRAFIARLPFLTTIHAAFLVEVQA
jgi:hypothetical protein